MSDLRELVVAFRAALASFDVGALAPGDCAALVTELTAARKACGAVEAVVAARAASSGAHRRAGFADAGDWLAALSGTTTHDARVALTTVAAVDACPSTRDALFAGRVSLAQAREITRAQSDAPGSEAELLDLAEGASLGRVRDAARKRRTEAIDPDLLYAKQRATRSFVHWRDELGMVCFRGQVMPEVGIPFLKRIETEAHRLRRAAPKAGAAEPFEAHAADAFVAIVAGGGTGKARAGSADLVLVCDIAAYLRGHAHPGEVSKIVGCGPLPVSVVRALSENAFLEVVLHDGTQVQTVAHYGRSIPARVRTALELGFPPEFDGAVCSEESCHRRYDLELDHDDPVANGGVTNLSNIKAKCRPDHWAKTERDRAAGLLRGRSP